MDMISLNTPSYKSVKQLRRQTRTAGQLPENANLLAIFWDATKHASDQFKKAQEARHQFITVQDSRSTGVSHARRTVDSETGQSTKEWTTMKYAPSVLPKGGDVEHKKIFQERQAYNASRQQELNKQSDELRKQAAQVKTVDRWQMRMQKQRNREYYKMRLAAKAKVPTLDPREDITLNVRLEKYARNHACDCNLRPNKIRAVAQQTVTDPGFHVSCNHKLSHPDDASPLQCAHCGCYKTRVFRTPCNCLFSLCSRCRYSTFHYPSQQYFDKHSQSEQLIVISEGPKRNVPSAFVKREDIVSETPLEQHLKETTVTKNRFSSRVERKNFFLALRGKKQISFAAVAAGKIVESEEQGGYMSSMAQTGKNMAQSVYDNVKNILSSVVDTFSKFQKKIKEICGKYSWLAPIYSFVESVLYVCKCLLGYLDLVTAVSIFDLIKSVTDTTLTGGLLTLARIGSLFNHLQQMELVSATKYAKLNSVDAIMNTNFGCFTHPVREYLRTTALREVDGEWHIIHGQLDRINSLNKNEVLLEKFAYFTNINKEKVIEQAGCEGIAGLLSGLCSSLPKRFGPGLKLLVEFAKYFLPLVSAANGIVRLSQTISTGISKVIGFWTDSFKNPREWLQAKLYDDSNPIGKMMACYITYRSLLYQSSKRPVPLEEVRTQYYSARALADTYIMENKKFCSDYAALLRAHDMGMSETGLPEDRPFEPTTLCLYGFPGTGKSTSWPIIISRAIRDIEKVPNKLEHIKAYTYTWQTVSEFTPGLSKAKVVLFDDFGQDRGESKEALNLIHLATTAPFSINSANITGPEVKGLFATPEVVVVCTNDKELCSDGVYDKEAVHRRMDLYLTTLERFDAEDPDKEIFQVTSCPYYAGLEGKKISMPVATMLFAMINAKKKAQFEETRAKVQNRVDSAQCEIVMDKALSATVMHENVVNTNLWKEDQDFQKDWALYAEFLKAPEDEKSTLLRRLAQKKPQQAQKGPQEKTYRIRRYDEKGVYYKAYKESEMTQDLYLEYENARARVDVSDDEQAGYDVSAYIANVGSGIATGFVSGGSVAVIMAWTKWIISAHEYNGGGLAEVKNLLFNLFRTLATTAVVCSAFYFLKKYYYDGTDQSGVTRTAKAAKPALSITSTPQGGNEVFSTLAYKATGTIVRSDGMTVNCLFIGGHYILTVNHFFQDYGTDRLISDGTKISITKSTWNGTVKTFKFERSSLKVLKSGRNFADLRDVREDVVLYKLDFMLFNSEKKIWHHFWNAEYDLTNFNVTKVDYVTKAFNPTSLEADEKLLSTGKVVDDYVYTSRTKGSSTYWHVAAKATYTERSCSCGSAIMLEHTQEHPLVGIHIAKAGNDSLFHFVTRDAIAALLENDDIVDVEQSAVNPDGVKIDILPPNSVLEFVGTVDKPVHQNEKTDLCHSTVYEIMGEHLTEPSVLKWNDRRIGGCFKNSLEFHRKLFEGYNQSAHFEQDELQQAFESVLEDNRALSRASVVPPRIANMAEILNGFEFIPGQTRMDMSTSAGYPYTVEHLNKKALFNVDNSGFITPKERIIKDFNKAIEDLKNGIVPFCPFSLTIKDERLKLEKVYLNVKSRLFAASSVIHYMIMRKYCLSHLLVHYNTRKSYSAVGIDRLSLDWHEMIIELAKAGEEGFDADFKFWDRSITRILLVYAVEIELDSVRSDIIKELGILGYRTLVEFSTRATYIYLNQVYHAYGTVASGGLMTFLRNCHINEILHRAAFFQLSRIYAPLMCNSLAYHQTNKGKRGGDDTVQVVSDSISDFFNGETFAAWVNSHGMACTAVDKSEHNVRLKRICDLSFLKNTTVYKNGFYLPKPDYSSVVEMMYWIRLNKQNNDCHRATQDNVNCALRSLYFYGISQYNKVRNAVLEKHPSYKLNTYGENNVIWSTYFYFPGSHSDFVTKQDQDYGVLVYGESKHSPSPALIHNLNMNLNSIEQSGIDKAAQDLSQNDLSVSMTETENETGAAKSETPLISTDAKEKNRTKQVGTSIQEAEAPISGTSLTAEKKFSSKNTRAQLHCNDIDWTLERLELKYTIIDDKQWTISQPQGTLIRSLNVPQDILITPAMKAPFDVTAFWKPEAVMFRVIVKASPFYSGRLVVGFIPTMRVTSESIIGSNYPFDKIIQIGGKQLNVADNQTVEFMVPYRHYKGFIESPKDCLGQFVIYVVNPLRTGPSNPNNVLITITAAIKGSEFKVPEYVPSSAYNSHKFGAKEIYSTEQAGDVQRPTPVAQASINSDIDDMHEVMMCAGVGYTSEPKITHFQDHPVDAVQLFKRFRTTAANELVIDADSSIYVSFPVTDLKIESAGWLATMNQLYRGSLLCKLSIASADDNQTALINQIQGRVYVGTELQTPLKPYPLAEVLDGYMGGFHLFNVNEPAEFMVPYLSPCFTSTYYTNPDDPFAREHSYIYVLLENPTKTKVPVAWTLTTCLADDFSSGVFTGTPSDMIPVAARRKRPVRYVVSVPQSGFPEPVNWEPLGSFAKRPKEEADLGTPITLGVYQGACVPTQPLDIEACFTKLAKGKFMTDGQMRRLFLYCESLENPGQREKDFLASHVRGFYFKSVHSDEQAGIIDFLDRAVDTTLPIVELADKIGNLLDAHPVTYQRYPVTNRKFGYTVSTDNVQYVERMAVTNHNGLSLTDKEAYGNTRETNIYELMRKTRTLIDTIPWTTSQAPKTLLKSYKVGPTGRSTFNYTPPMDVFADQFTFWNGSVVYLFDVTASQMHHGQLTATFHPNLSTPPPSLNLATQQYFTSFDLADGRSFIAVVVPYLSNVPYKPIKHANAVSYPDEDHYNGIICLWVQNALRASTTVSDTVDINVYKMAGKDFRLEVFGSNLIFMSPPGKRA